MPGEYRLTGVTLATLRHQRVSRYLATAVTTAQRLMRAIVAASRPKLPRFRRRIADKCARADAGGCTFIFER